MSDARRRRGQQNRRIATVTVVYSAALGVRSYASAADAIAGALELHRGGDRIGIVTGDDDDVSVAAAHRLAADAHPGQVLVSEATAKVLTLLPPDTHVVGVGHRDALQLVHPKLAWSFPAPHAGERSPLVGRRDELATLAALIGEARVVTIVGPAGSGKTRLAEELARRIRPDYDEWRAVDLTGVRDSSLVASAVAGSLSISEVPFQDTASLIGAAIGDRRFLLLLDNCEHLVDACASLVADIVARCPRAAVVGTSREPLERAVAGVEHVFRIGPLPVPPEETEDLPALLASDAARLFVARMAPSAFDPPTVKAIAEITRRLDGIPLALELAAGWTSTRSVAEIAAGLPRGARALDESIEWSHELLTDSEATLFRRLAVFGPGFTAAQAGAVCNEVGDLGRLVAHSLVQQSGARYRLLETIRDFAWRKLVAAGEDRAIRDAHLDAYLAVADAGAEPADLDNLRPAMDWSVESGRADAAMQLAGLVYMHWWTRTHLREAAIRLEAALEMEGHDPRSRAMALVAAARNAIGLFDIRAIRSRAEEALTLAHALGDDLLAGRASVMLGWAAAFAEPKKAYALYERAAVAAENCGDLWHLSEALNGLAVLEAISGKHEAADAMFGRARAAARDSGLAFQVVLVQAWSAAFTALRGDFDNAEPKLAAAVEQASAISDEYFVTLATAFLAFTALWKGDASRCADLVARADELARQRGFVAALAVVDLVAAELGLLEGRLDDAERAGREGLAVFEAAAWMFGRAWSTNTLGAIALGRGDLVAARRDFETALALARQIPSPREEIRALLGMAELAEDAAEGATALRLAVDSGYPREQRLALELLAALTGDAGLDLARGLSLAPARRKSHAIGWESLTPAELRIVRLVAQGLTNPKIGEQLFITPGTVRIHLSNVFRKVGVTTRAALAAEAARREI